VRPDLANAGLGELESALERAREQFSA
jgi:hypothetical protein